MYYAYYSQSVVNISSDKICLLKYQTKLIEILHINNSSFKICPRLFLGQMVRQIWGKL